MRALNVEQLNREDIGGLAQLVERHDHRWPQLLLVTPPVQDRRDRGKRTRFQVLQHNQDVHVGELFVEVLAGRGAI
jgi:hypothetical protein